MRCGVQNDQIWSLDYIRRCVWIRSDVELDYVRRGVQMNEKLMITSSWRCDLDVHAVRA